MSALYGNIFLLIILTLKAAIVKLIRLLNLESENEARQDSGGFFNERSLIDV
jgi:hypothetical protein